MGEERGRGRGRISKETRSLTYGRGACFVGSEIKLVTK